jgi:hypothetical protein
MGSLSDSKIADFEKKHLVWLRRNGVVPARGERAELLRNLLSNMRDLVEVLELELSGFRDGDGCWYPDPIVPAAADVAESLDRLLKFYAAEEPKPVKQKMPRPTKATAKKKSTAKKRT